MNNYWENSTQDYGCETENKQKWSVEELEKCDFQVEELIFCLHVIDRFKKKYPNDEIPANMDELIRDEICRIFGGSLCDE